MPATAHPLRPQFHFTPIQGWLNDPNGLIWLDGEYHLFYQWSPKLAVTDALDMHWGHAVSRDLVHWEHLPIALAPGPLGAAWSGSAVYDRDDRSGFFDQHPGGGLVAIFTHHDVTTHAERQSLAYSRDRGRTWTEYGGNPVLGDATSRDFRDPKVFWHAPTSRWVMIVGVQHRLYSSSNLKNWTLLQELPYASECPDLMELPIEGSRETRWVLNLGGREYVVGRFDGQAFSAESEPRTVDGGLDFYAPMSWNDVPALTADEHAMEGAPGAALEKTDRRTLWIGWICNWKYAKTVPDFGARGVLTVPRELMLRPRSDGSFRLIQRPAREVATQARRIRIVDDPCAETCFCSTNTGAATARFRVAAGDVCGFRLLVDGHHPRAPLVSADGTSSTYGAGAERPSARQSTVVGYDDREKCWFLERKPNVPTLTAERFTWPADPLRPVVGREVEARVLLDRSVVEIFLDDGEVVFTSLIFADDASRFSHWFSTSGESKLVWCSQRE